MRERILLLFVETIAVADATAWSPAAFGLIGLGTNAAPAIPFLIPALQNTNASVRNTALLALSAIHVSPETTVPAILPFVAAYPIVERLWLRDKLPADTVEKHEELAEE